MNRRREIVVYIAGPFRAKSAEELALEVWKLGFTAICPHTNTRFYQGALPDSVWLAGDLEILERCDALLLAPNWQDSRGARDEAASAAKSKMPIFESLIELEFWAMNRGAFGIVEKAEIACATA